MNKPITGPTADLHRAKAKLRFPLLALAVVIAGAFALNNAISASIEASRNRIESLKKQQLDLSEDVYTLENSVNRYDERLPLYQQLARRGLLTPPDYAEAERIIRRAAELSSINEAVFDVQRAESFTLRDAGSIRTVLDSTAIQIRMESLLDEHIFSFIARIQSELPGLVVLREIEIERTSPTTGPIVNAILEDNPSERPSLFRATVTLDWVSLSTSSPEEGS